MTEKTKKEQEISDLCDEHGCSPKIRKIHFDQYVHRRWHPHPSAEFELWWPSQGEAQAGIDAKRAWNCDSHRQAFLAAKEIGAA